VQFEAKGQRPGAIAGHENDRGLDCARAWLAQPQVDHGDRRGPGPAAVSRPARIAATQLGDPVCARDGLRNHPGGLRGQREPAQMRRGPVAVEHLDTGAHEPAHRQLRVPRRARGGACAESRPDGRSNTCGAGSHIGRCPRSAGRGFGGRAGNARGDWQPGMRTFAGLAWLRDPIGSPAGSPACAVGRLATLGAGDGLSRPRRFLRLRAGRPNQRQLVRRLPGLGVALVVERRFVLRRPPQPDRRSRTSWRHLDRRHTRTANPCVCLRLPTTASVPGLPSHRQCPMWITAQHG
jgi:hypothetical protein